MSPTRVMDLFKKCPKARRKKPVETSYCPDCRLMVEVTRRGFHLRCTRCGNPVD